MSPRGLRLHTGGRGDPPGRIRAIIPLARFVCGRANTSVEQKGNTHHETHPKPGEVAVAGQARNLHRLPLRRLQRDARLLRRRRTGRLQRQGQVRRIAKSPTLTRSQHTWLAKGRGSVVRASPHAIVNRNSLIPPDRLCPLRRFRRFPFPFQS